MVCKLMGSTLHKVHPDPAVHEVRRLCRISVHGNVTPNLRGLLFDVEGECSVEHV